MIRAATVEDQRDIERFLASYPETSMFLRSNLSHGIGWTEHPHSTRYFLCVGSSGLQGVFGLTRNGFLMVQCPELADRCFADFAHAVLGETVCGMTGETKAVAATLDHLGLAGAAFALNEDEPLMRVDLARIETPDCDLRAPEHADSDLLLDWFTQYELDTGLAPAKDSARKNAEARIARMTDGHPSLRLLIDDEDTPLAMADINARLPDIVQIGGVFVPAAARGKGLGRRVTAALLAEARAEGARTAILFASGTAARRAYEAIGFETVGTYRVAILKTPQTVGASA